MTGTALPTTDTLATLADTTVNDLVSAELAVAETAVIAAYPPLGWPGLKQLWEIPLRYFIGQLGNGLAKLTGYVVIDIQKYFALQAAGSALVALNAAKASGNQDAINQASTAADAAVAPILHYVGSA